jgi:hypothetical protein
MMATDFTMYSGDTVNVAVTITDSNGDAVDLTGATSSWVLTSFSGSTVYVTKSSGAGTITYGGVSTNVATVALTASDTDDLDGIFRHELEIVDSTNNVSTVCVGTVVIEAEAT